MSVSLLYPGIHSGRIPTVRRPLRQASVYHHSRQAPEQRNYTFYSIQCLAAPTMHCEPDKGESSSLLFVQGRHNHIVNWLHSTMALLRCVVLMSSSLTKASLPLSLCLSVQSGTFAGRTIPSAWSTGTLIAACNQGSAKCAAHPFDYREAERREHGR